MTTLQAKSINLCPWAKIKALGYILSGGSRGASISLPFKLLGVLPPSPCPPPPPLWDLPLLIVTFLPPS